MWERGLAPKFRPTWAQRQLLTDRAWKENERKTW